MRRLVLILILVLLFGGVSNAQKVGYVNTQTILTQIPDYANAMQTLEKLSKQYQQYIDTEKGKIEEFYLRYQAERPKLNEAERQKRERDIISMERNLQEKQKEYFGEGGVMASKSEQLLNPIRARVDNAIKKVAAKYGYSLVIDLSAVQGVVYNDGTLDVSMEVVGNL